MLNQFSRLRNFTYFYRRRIALNLGVVSCGSVLFYKAKDSNNEVLRFAVAGCVSNLAVESLFHFVDTVNIRSKALTT
jgi:hypothetical protein